VVGEWRQGISLYTSRKVCTENKHVSCSVLNYEFKKDLKSDFCFSVNSCKFLHQQLLELNPA